MVLVAELVVFGFLDGLGVRDGLADCDRWMRVERRRISSDGCGEYRSSFAADATVPERSLMVSNFWDLL